MPTRTARFTGAGPQPCAAASLPLGAGLEPCMSAEDAGRPCVPNSPYARRDSNPQIHAPQACPSASCGTSVREPPSGADPDVPPYEDGAAAVRGGMASGGGVEPPGAWFRAILGCRQPTRKRYAGRELNPHTARFGLASFAG